MTAIKENIDVDSQNSPMRPPRIKDPRLKSKAKGREYSTEIQIISNPLRQQIFLQPRAIYCIYFITPILYIRRFYLPAFIS